MKFLYNELFGTVPVGYMIVLWSLLWACGWYAKNHPLKGLIVAWVAFAVLPILGFVLHFALTATVGLWMDFVIGKNSGDGVVALLNAMSLLGMLFWYTISAREMRHMRGEHSVATGGYRFTETSPMKKRITIG